MNNASHIAIFSETKKPSCILISTSWHCSPRSAMTWHIGCARIAKIGFHSM